VLVVHCVPTSNCNLGHSPSRDRVALLPCTSSLADSPLGSVSGPAPARSVCQGVAAASRAAWAVGGRRLGSTAPPGSRSQGADILEQGMKVCFGPSADGVMHKGHWHTGCGPLLAWAPAGFPASILAGGAAGLPDSPTAQVQLAHSSTTQQPDCAARPWQHLLLVSLPIRTPGGSGHRQGRTAGVGCVQGPARTTAVSSR
jgi:hypothetical protein